MRSKREMELGNGNAAGWLDRREERGVATLAHGFDVSAIGLTAPDASAVDLVDVAGKPLVVQVLRYWG